METLTINCLESYGIAKNSQSGSIVSDKELARATIIPPYSELTNCKLAASIIGRRSILKDCTIVESTLQSDSILINCRLEACYISNANVLVDCLVIRSYTEGCCKFAGCELFSSKLEPTDRIQNSTSLNT